MISDVHSTSDPRADDNMDPGLRSRLWDTAHKTRREVRRERKQKAERSRRNRLNESFSELQNLVLCGDNKQLVHVDSCLNVAHGSLSSPVTRTG
ncbi:hypothetical protein C0Q70_03677 [Pomacea canaliculata]|uniref:BHLH domain-containing protein n=1 Tax=Pomacea canaliculata TaxID=400727 RepID=A0A2T7PTE1_POMCA|nr:hypothetical protein C0Q70_03677 [Pomacea canaliculata]